MNQYPVVIAETGTYVGNARWGQNAEQRAKDDAIEMAIHFRKLAKINGRSEFIYEINVVSGKSRKEVADTYEIKDENSWNY